MRIGAKYSHLNGEEYLLVHHQAIWSEVQKVISEVDAQACKTKVSKERTMPGKMLYSPTEMNKAFQVGFQATGWREQRKSFWTTEDGKLLRKIQGEPDVEQFQKISVAGYSPIKTYNQTDYVKNRVAVEVQFGKYSFVAHDLFVKHVSFYVADIIDVGIEILPMKALEKEMSTGVPYYERDLLNVIRQGRSVPAVPLVLIGVLP